MMAVRIVPGPTEQDVRGPRAAGLAHVGVVTTTAEAPQLSGRSAAIHTQFVRLPPDLFQIAIANVAAGVRRSRQRRASLDSAVGLDPERVLSGVTTGPVDSIIAAAAPQRFVRAEVPDVVTRQQQEPTVRAFLVKLGEQRHEFEKLVRLQQ